MRKARKKRAKKRRWTDEEREIVIKRSSRGETSMQVSRHIDRTPGAIDNFLSRIGFVRKAGFRSWTTQEKIFLVENIHKGRRFVAQSLGRTISSVDSMATRLRNKKRRKNKRRD